jgi:5'-3' exonuclease
MGVPSLYRTLVSSYETIQDVSRNNTDFLFLDFNCLIHHCLRVANSDMSHREMEESVITEVLRYAIYIVTKVVMPSRLVYIAIDGPVPVAKMERQRSRRFKKIQDSAFSQRMRKKYNMEESRSFDSNKITPGTMFMSKLNSRLKNYITIGAFASHVKKGTSMKVICSDSNVPGEGEYKIFEYLRQCNLQHFNNIHVYGMDADLIILSMASNLPNIRLMREASTVDDKVAEFVYIDIDQCKKSLYNDCVSGDMRPSLSIDAYIRDFVLYSMFGGNDFVYALPHCKMRNGGLEKLTRVYTIVFSMLNTPLVRCDGTINFTFLKAFINRLSESEDIGMKNNTKRRYNNDEVMTYEREIELYEHSEYSNPKNPFYMFYKDDIVSVNYNDKYRMWVDKYNAHFFDEPLESIVTEYIKSIVWTHKYYYGKVLSWTYFNTHRTSPTLSTLTEHLNILHLDPSFHSDEALTPFEQLLYVLPSQSCKLLPYALQEMVIDHESPIQHYFPIKFKLDVVSGGKNIYSEAILPPIHIPDIIRVVQNVPFNDHEIMRNSIVKNAFHKTFSSF